MEINKKNIRKYIKERRSILNKKEMDINEIKRLSKKHNLKIPKDDESILLGAHYGRMMLLDISMELKIDSYLWVKENGFDFPVEIMITPEYETLIKEIEKRKCNE